MKAPYLLTDRPVHVQSTKYLYLESLRGCASMIVVVCHFAAAFFPHAVFGKPYVEIAPWESWFATTPLSLLFAAHFAVCLFFVLSGYVLSLPYVGKSNRDAISIQAAIVKRPVRLGGLVVATIVLSILLSSLGLYYNISASSLSGSNPWLSQYFASDRPLWSLDMLRLFANGKYYNPPLWTIKQELYGSMLTYLFLLLFRASAWRWIAYAIAMIVFHRSLYHGFLFGMLLADLSQTFPERWESLKLPRFSVPLLVVGVLAASVPNYIDHKSLAGYSLLPKIRFLGGEYAMLGAVLLFCGTLLNPRLQVLLSNKFLAYIGRISFSVYAIHFLVLCSLSSWLLVRFHGSMDYQALALLNFIAYLICTIAIAHMLTVLVDEPTTRLANRLAGFYQSKVRSKTSRDTLSNA